MTKWEDLTSEEKRNFEIFSIKIAYGLYYMDKGCTSEEATSLSIKKVKELNESGYFDAI